MFLVLMYAKNSNNEPTPCMKSANMSIIGLNACKEANITITKARERITDNLRLFEYL